MEDHQEGSITCPSALPHNLVRDHVTHYLGCIDIRDRKGYFNLSQSHWHGSVDAHREAEQAKEQINFELRSIRETREAILKNNDQFHIVRNVEESGNTWRSSPEYHMGIPQVRRWKSLSGAGRGSVSHKDTNRNDDPTPYPDSSNNTTDRAPHETVSDAAHGYVMRLPRPTEDPDTQSTLRIYEHKLSVQDLLSRKDPWSMALPSQESSKYIRYYHLPANNMEWVEEAIRRYAEGHLSQPGREVEPNDPALLQEVSRILPPHLWRGRQHPKRHDLPLRHQLPVCVRLGDVGSRWSPSARYMILMPYLHWDTVHHHRAISNLIANVTHEYRRARRYEEERDREQRKLAEYRRRNPASSGSSSPASPARSNARVDVPTTGTSAGNLRQSPIRSFTRLAAIKFPQFKSFRKFYFDQYGRLIVYSALGQYLIDAARLFTAMTLYQDATIIRRYLFANTPIHPRRSLNQAKFWTTDPANDGDRDQVVWNATRPNNIQPHELPDDQSSIASSVSRLIMVDQLWMWILDPSTVVTAFPTQYGYRKHELSDTHSSLRARLHTMGIQHNPIAFSYHLALVIIDECTDALFDRLSPPAGEPQVISIFSEKVDDIRKKHNMLLHELLRWSESIAALQLSAIRGITPREFLERCPLPASITAEANLQVETNHVIEELENLVHITRMQAKTVRTFCNLFSQKKVEGIRELQARELQARELQARHQVKFETVNTIWEDKELSNCAGNLQRKLDERLRSLEELRDNAREVTRGLKDTLALKEQQDNIIQGWRTQLESSKMMDQNRSILVFTIVTIIFERPRAIPLPLSFLATVFGMNASEFSSENNMSIRDQFKYIFPLSATVILPTVIFALTDVAHDIWILLGDYINELSLYLGFQDLAVGIRRAAGEASSASRERVAKATGRRAD
ncbi:hypothetical protein N656DRAFT_847246 [Canariomyces notabilis]|uniref:Uncharacterized protein n=1 Tax=Canariomyces notabilis TaxID=2074819 RepID=A0AAN6TAJ8_9PEZI|nr:hypothetical protein N656DRAFT_847246 [Canariomyces arenarius]